MEDRPQPPKTMAKGRIRRRTTTSALTTASALSLLAATSLPSRLPTATALWDPDNPPGGELPDPDMSYIAGDGTTEDGDVVTITDAAAGGGSTTDAADAASYPCGCQSCTSYVLDALLPPTSVSSTCHDHIVFLQAALGYDEQAACKYVAGEEYPDICGPHCDPERCHDYDDPTAAPTQAPTDAPTRAPTRAPTKAVDTEEQDYCPTGDEWPSPNTACPALMTTGTTCTYGQECCCGQCSHSYSCTCTDSGTFVCLYSDFCYAANCEGEGEVQDTLAPFASPIVETAAPTTSAPTSKPTSAPTVKPTLNTAEQQALDDATCNSVPKDNCALCLDTLLPSDDAESCTYFPNWGCFAQQWLSGLGSGITQGGACPEVGSPTASPTVVPTIAPTSKPTVEPTNAPTAKPTLDPAQVQLDHDTCFAQTNCDDCMITTLPSDKSKTCHWFPGLNKCFSQKCFDTSLGCGMENEGECPSAAMSPTSKPTVVPTVAPTGAPTGKPTVVPTGAPTEDTGISTGEQTTTTATSTTTATATTTITTTSATTTTTNTFPCGCRSCTSYVLDAYAVNIPLYGGTSTTTCADRIDYLQTPDGGSLSEVQACRIVGGTQFIEECGGCDPDSCDATEAPTEAPTSAPTEEPTKMPHVSPTGVPTHSPTREPTKEDSTPTDSTTTTTTTLTTTTPQEVLISTVTGIFFELHGLNRTLTPQELDVLHDRMESHIKDYYTSNSANATVVDVSIIVTNQLLDASSPDGTTTLQLIYNQATTYYRTSSEPGDAVVSSSALVEGPFDDASQRDAFVAALQEQGGGDSGVFQGVTGVSAASAPDEPGVGFTPVTATVSGVTIELNGVDGILSEEDLQVFEAQTEAYILEYYANSKVTIMDVTVNVTDQILMTTAANNNETSSLLRIVYDQTTAYHTTEPDLIVTANELVEKPFDDETKQDAYVAALQDQEDSTAFEGVTGVSAASVPVTETVSGVTMDLVGVDGVLSEDDVGVFEAMTEAYVEEYYSGSSNSSIVIQDVSIDVTDQVVVSTVNNETAVQIMYDQTITYHTTDPDDVSANEIVRDPFDDASKQEDFVAVLQDQEDTAAFNGVTGVSAASAPTPAPTAAPTGAPTSAPTDAPTSSPTPIAVDDNAEACAALRNGTTLVTSIEVDVTFLYELFLSNASSLNETGAADLIESQVQERVAPVLVGCTEAVGNSRLRKARRKRRRRMEEGRSLQIIGVDSDAVDELPTGTACVSSPLPGESCTMMRGGVRLYLRENSTDSSIAESTLDTLKALRDASDASELDRPDQGVRFRFLGGDNLDEVDGGDETTETEDVGGGSQGDANVAGAEQGSRSVDDDNALTGAGIAFITLAVVGVLLVLFIAVRRRKSIKSRELLVDSQDDDDEEEAYRGNVPTDGKPRQSVRELNVRFHDVDLGDDSQSESDGTSMLSSTPRPPPRHMFLASVLGEDDDDDDSLPDMQERQESALPSHSNGYNWPDYKNDPTFVSTASMFNDDDESTVASRASRGNVELTLDSVLNRSYVVDDTVLL